MVYCVYITVHRAARAWPRNPAIGGMIDVTSMRRPIVSYFPPLPVLSFCMSCTMTTVWSGWTISGSVSRICRPWNVSTLASLP